MRTGGIEALGAAVLLTACTVAGGGPRRGADTSSNGVVVTRDVPIADVTTADVFAPDGADGLPVVVMFHGTEGLRSRMEPLATEVAAAGAVVVVPTWPLIPERPEWDTTDDIYLPQAAAAVCAVRFVHASAVGYGGDPDDVTVLGHSGGAPVGARVALVEDPPWPGIGCYPGVSSHVDRFVGTGGDYADEAQYGSWASEVHGPYDVRELVVTNLDLEVRLVHGAADSNVHSSASIDFDDHLDAIGVDSRLVFVDAGHAELIDPSAPGGAFAAREVAALVAGDPSAFDEAGAAATMTFDQDGCRYEGISAVPVDGLLRIVLSNDTEVPVHFSLVGFGVGLTDDEVTDFLTREPERLENVPPDVEVAVFVRTEAGDAGDMAWVFPSGGRRWLAYCMPEGDSGHPQEGRMFAAAEVVLEP